MMETPSLWMFLLLFTAVTGHFSITARFGEDVSLPCGSVIQHQQGCDRTSWLYSPQEGKASEELITNGKSGTGEAARAVRGRLHVPADCSLLIKNVSVVDAGRFTCRQYTSESEHTDSRVFLSVINIILDDALRFYCNVFRYGECEHTVQWDYKGDNGDINTYTDPPCTATLTFNNLPNFKDFKKQLFCNVTDKKSGEMLLCDAMDESSHQRAGKGESSEGGGGRTSPIPESGAPPYPDWLPFVLVGLAVLFLVLVISVVFIRRRKLKGQQSPRDDINEDPDVAVAYASVSFTKTSSTDQKIQAAGPDGDAVTYSPLRVPPADASSLYATVNKPKKGR